LAFNRVLVLQCLSCEFAITKIIYCVFKSFCIYFRSLIAYNLKQSSCLEISQFSCYLMNPFFLFHLFIKIIVCLLGVLKIVKSFFPHFSAISHLLSQSSLVFNSDCTTDKNVVLIINFLYLVLPGYLRHKHGHHLAVNWPYFWTI
jgi:hypothetical protein